MEMRFHFTNNLLRMFVIFVFFLSFFELYAAQQEGEKASSLLYLLPEIGSWKLSETPQTYSPLSLFEYIDGAAEIYLSYDFKELMVAHYQMEADSASLTLEIYDMGEGKNSFGIYSAERYPESNFISVGNEGYWEGETLNFVVGAYYAKLLCYDCKEDAERTLKLFSEEVVKRVKEKGNLPALLQVFPKQGLISKSEKFILRNFLGFAFLHNGYLADYKTKDFEFSCFFVEGGSPEEAEEMLKQYLDFYKKDTQLVQEMTLGYHLRDRRSEHLYLAKVQNFLCGVMRIKDGFEEVGESYLEMLVKSLKK